MGGARITLGVFLGMTACTAVAIRGVERHSFAVFFASYVGIFLLAGMGNGSIYKMIPNVFQTLGRSDAARTGLDLKPTLLVYKRQAAAVIGLTGAIGAFGGVLIQVVLREASLGVSNLVSAATTPAAKASVAMAHADWSVSALWVFMVSYVVLAVITWAVYLRSPFALAMRNARLAGAAS
jgi:NNP family nitrate/nitrite transporter-like MFS transporter